jgi:hypothetical protein
VRHLEQRFELRLVGDAATRGQQLGVGEQGGLGRIAADGRERRQLVESLG